MLALLQLAQRRVRTAEGARLYGKPIGSVIGETTDPESDGQDRPVTIERLKSIQAQFEDAKRTGNTALMKDLQAEFAAAVTEFRKTRQDPNLLRKLVASGGRQSQQSTKGE